MQIEPALRSPTVVLVNDEIAYLVHVFRKNVATVSQRLQRFTSQI